MPGTGAGDISLIYQYMKMLDPDTGVREGEYANAAQTGGLPERVVASYNKLVSGERLTDAQRADFVNQAGRMLQNRHAQVSRAATYTRNLAKGYGLDPDNVARLDPYSFQAWQPPVDPNTGVRRNDPGGVERERAASAPGAAPQTAIRVPDDPNMAARTLRSLPAGSWWVGPDGTPRRKPGGSDGGRR